MELEIPVPHNAAIPVTDPLLGGLTRRHSPVTFRVVFKLSQFVYTGVLPTCDAEMVQNFDAKKAVLS